MGGSRILVCDPIHDAGIQILSKAGYNVENMSSITASELVDIIGDFDAVIVRSRTMVTEQILDAGKKLKVVARAGVGLDNIDLNVAKRLGIIVINSPEAPSNAVAELVLGLMFSLARRIPEADFSMKKGEWIKKRLTGIELKGRTLGIIGFGRIGYQLAKKAGVLEMRVLAYDIVIDKLMEYVNEAGAKCCGLGGAPCFL